MVRDTEAHERFLDHAALGVDPVRDRDVAVAQRAVLVVGPAREQLRHPAAPPGPDELLDLAGYERGLLVLVVGVEQRYLGTGPAIGPEALVLAYVFFFQAEDGIRDGTVTGVQTCALPI